MRLQGKVALITGAATGIEGQTMGFGGASARLSAREGARVVVADVNESDGERTAAQIAESGGDAIFKRLDVASEREWSEAIAAAVQYAPEDIRVNSVHPGFALTPLTEEAFSDPKLMAPGMASVPLGRLGNANGIVYLAPDESSFVTGSELVTDGGVTAQ